MELLGRFAGWASQRAMAEAVAMALVATIVFFGSVLAHELAHALEARHRGVEVEGITVYLFGGATAMVSEAERPGDAFGTVGTA